MDSAQAHDNPMVADIEAARRMGRETGCDLSNQANACPYAPTDAERHRAWMDGFSEGRVSAAC